MSTQAFVRALMVLLKLPIYEWVLITPLLDWIKSEFCISNIKPLLRRTSFYRKCQETGT